MSIQKRAETRSETRKLQILDAAEIVFAKKGFHESTISDIAKEAELSDATIYEYFSSKEELLFSIPLENTRREKESLDLHLKYIRGAENKIRSIVYHFLSGYYHHPNYASVVLLTLKPNRKFLQTEACQFVREIYGTIDKIIQEGIETGEFKKETDPYLIRSIIIGTIENLVIRWLLHDTSYDLEKYVDPLTDNIINGIRNRNSERQNDLNIHIAFEQDGKLNITKA